MARNWLYQLHLPNTLLQDHKSYEYQVPFYANWLSIDLLLFMNYQFLVQNTHTYIFLVHIWATQHAPILFHPVHDRISSGLFTMFLYTILCWIVSSTLIYVQIYWWFLVIRSIFMKLVVERTSFLCSYGFELLMQLLFT